MVIIPIDTKVDANCVSCRLIGFSLNLHDYLIYQMGII